MSVIPAIAIFIAMAPDKLAANGAPTSAGTPSAWSAFKLRVRQEQRELPVYALRLSRSDGKLGSALRPVEKRDCVNDAPGGWCGIRGQGPGRVSGQQATIDTLVLGLGGSLDRVVINQTGLSGVFDFTLQFTPTNAELGPTPTDAPAPSIFTALQEQLGLELRAERAIVHVLRDRDRGKAGKLTGGGASRWTCLDM